MLTSFVSLLLWLAGAATAPLHAPPGATAVDSCAARYEQAEQATDPPRFELLQRRAHEALRCYEHRTDVPRDDRLKKLYYWEAYALRALDRYDDALRWHDRFFARFGPSSQATAPIDSVWSQHMYRSRGYTHYLMGNLAGAAGDYSQALRYAPATDKAPPFLRASLAHDLGTVFQRMRRFDQALRYYRQAGRLLEKAAPRAESPRLSRADLLRTRADLLIERAGAPSMAPRSEATENNSSDLQKAVDLLQESLGAGPSGKALLKTLTLLGKAHGSLGHFHRAREHLDRAHRLVRRMDEDHWHFQIARHLGQLHAKAGHLKQARAAFAEAEKRMDAALHADHRRGLLNDIGRLHELQGHPARAESYYRRAIAVAERYRASLGATEWAAQAFGQWQSAHRGLVRSLLAQHQPRPAFRALERLRARHLRDMRVQARMLGRLPSSQRARFDSLTRALTTVRNRLGSDTLRRTARLALQNREAHLMAARRTLTPSLQKPPALSIPAVQSALARRDRVLLSYFIDEGNAQWGRPARSHAFVVTSDTLRAVPLPASADTLRRLLRRAIPLSTSEARARDLSRFHFSLRALNNLHDRLFAPLRPYVSREAPLVVVPDGPLFGLPFGALVTASTSPYRYRDAPFLIRTHPIATLLSARLLLPAPPSPAPSVDLAAFGKTRFSDLSRSEAFQSSSFSDVSLPDLPAVTQEIATLRSLFSDVRTFQGAAATEPALAHALQQTKVLHVASHALTNPSSPLHSALLLSPSVGDSSEAARASDGLFYLHELQQLSSAARLVVLSGCSTARGTLRPGEGMAGLQSALRAAGTSSTLSTLWPAEDHTFATLMEAFYRHLRAGRPKDVALQRAQLTFLDEAPATRRNPFFWAAPVLYGRTTSLDLAALPLWLRYRGWTAGLAAFLVLGLCAAFYHRRHLAALTPFRRFT